MQLRQRFLFLGLAALASACGASSGAAGQPTWAKSYGTEWQDAAVEGAALPDGGFVLAAARNGTAEADSGGEPSQTGLDCWLLGIDAYGDVQWERVLGRPAGQKGARLLAVPGSLGGVLAISSEVLSEDNWNRDLTITRLDGTGALEWQKHGGLTAVSGEQLYFASRKPDDYPLDVRATSDGGIILAAVSKAQIADFGDGDLALPRSVDVPWLVRFSPGGDVMWQRQITDDVRGYAYLVLDDASALQEGGSSSPFTGLAAEFARVAEEVRQDSVYGIAGGPRGETFFWINGTFSDGAVRARIGCVDSGGIILWSTTVEDFKALGAAANENGKVLFVGAATSDDPPTPQACLFDGEGTPLWTVPFETGRGFRGAGEAPCPPSAECDFIGVQTEGDVSRVVRMRPDGTIAADIVLDVTDGALRHPFVAARVDAGGEHTDVYGVVGGSSVRVSLRWGTAEQTVTRVERDEPLRRLKGDGVGATCAWTDIGKLYRLDASLASTWESVSLERSGRPDSEVGLDIHAIGADTGGALDGYLLLGARADSGGFAPWIARLDDRGVPIWERVIRGATPVRRWVAFGDGGSILLHGGPKSAGTPPRLLTCATRWLGDGTPAWRVSGLLSGSRKHSMKYLVPSGPSSFAAVGGGLGWLDIELFGEDGHPVSRRAISVSDIDSGALGRQYTILPRACAVHPDGVLVVGSAAVAAEGADPASPPVDPQVFLIDVTFDGEVRHASMCRWAEPWRVVPPFRVARGPHGQVFVAATIENSIDGKRAGGHDWVLMSFDGEGTWEWAQAYGGLLDDTLSGLRALPDGGALLVGRSDSVEVRGDAWALCVASDGHVAASGCVAERERAVPDQSWALSLEVQSPATRDVTVEVPPFSDIVAVSSPTYPVTGTLVARQCLGFSTPPPDPGEGPPPPAPGPASVGILFASYRDGGDDREIWRVDIAGAGATRLTTNDWDDLDPAWSLDGTGIAFVSDEGLDGSYEVYVMQADGSGRTKVSDFRADGLSAATPAWSPEGNRIVVRVSRDEFFEGLRILTPATGAVQTLTTNASDDAPSWAPSAQIVFRRSDGIYVANPTTSAVQPVLTGITPIRGPAWSPNGAQIAFAQYANTYTRLFVMSANGTSVVPVTSGGLHRLDGSPAWLPGGSRLVFVRQNHTGDLLWTIDATGTNSNAALLPGQIGSVTGEPDAR